MTESEIPKHDPEIVVRELAQKLASRARHVCAFLGAGASASAGLPTLKELEDLVVKSVGRTSQLKALLVNRNLEQALSRIRRMAGLLEGEETLGGLSREQAQELDREICESIIGAVSLEQAETRPFVDFGQWAARVEHQDPLEVFTVNYDLLIEAGFEAIGLPYFDGFMGSVRAPFMPELVNPLEGTSSRQLPSGFVRVWKLHGSVNWVSQQMVGGQGTVRVGERAPKEPVAIFPSDEKYDESRRVPFVVLLDRFRQALIQPETITLVSGFSFSDDHLNEMIFDAARRFRRSEVVAFCYEEIPDALRSEALKTSNLLVLAKKIAIVGGIEAEWYAANDVPGVFEEGNFVLGDFAALSAFLARASGPEADGA
jgi:hypothetical protein